MSAAHRSGMLVTLRLRPFVLAVITALVIPVPSSFDTQSGGADAPILKTERCIALGYSDSGEGRWLPHAFRLQPERDRVFDRAGHTGYRAVGLPATLGSDQSGWRHTGRDSIDIGWHHSPALRLPVGILLSPETETLVGRAGNGQWTTLASAFVERNRFIVTARVVACRDLGPVT